MREDIQCLRGIAILFVLLFHFAPKIFVNGFLGVDLFFFISGFLMAKNLTANGKMTKFHDYLMFYYMRFRRILPLYYLAVLIITIMIHMLLGDFLWKNNDRYSLASLFMATNQLVIHDQADYFNQFLASIDSINGFLHLWSLSVEMQFYLFVPIIFFGIKFLKNDYLKLTTCVLIVLFGFAAFAMVLDRFAFNFMFLRLWQFASGFCALFWSKIRSNKTKSNDISSRFPLSKEEIVTISLCFLGLCLLPKKLEVLVFRPLVTVFTAIIIACEAPNVQRGTGNMSILVIGNSYVVNLVENIRAPFNKNYSDFRYLSVFSSFGPYSGFSSQSKEALDFTKQQVEKFKPDVLFVVARYLETIKDPVRDNDPLVQQMDETIEFYEKFVKKIYILGAHPTYKENFLDTFLQYLLTWPHNLDLLHLDKKLADDEMRSARERFARVKCKKCHFFDLSHVFAEGEKYLTFDRQTLIAYADNAVHLTTAGVEICDPVFKRVAGEIMKES